jgi:hypothetical protein
VKDLRDAWRNKGEGQQAPHKYRKQLRPPPSGKGHMQIIQRLFKYHDLSSVSQVINAKTAEKGSAFLLTRSIFRKISCLEFQLQLAFSRFAG